MRCGLRGGHGRGRSIRAYLATRVRLPWRVAVCAGLVALAACGAGGGEPADPVTAVVDLLEQDEAFAAASARTEVVDAIPPIFAAGVMTPVPGRGWLEGREHALAGLRANPAHAGARLSWIPVRGGVSGDGLHGFTFGYMTLYQAGGDSVPLKYLSYWVRDTSGWRVLAWKRRPRMAGEVDAARMPPFTPAGVVPVRDTARLAELTASLAAAEQAFSDEAQRVGLGRAFVRWGRADAINLGGPGVAGFVVGAEAIGAHVGGGDTTSTSPVEWNADRAVVASSGDLGITFGMIRPRQPGSAPVPFFTVWARESPGAAWRYIAE